MALLLNLVFSVFGRSDICVPEMFGVGDFREMFVKPRSGVSQPFPRKSFCAPSHSNPPQYLALNLIIP